MIFINLSLVREYCLQGQPWASYRGYCSGQSKGSSPMRSSEEDSLISNSYLWNLHGEGRGCDHTKEKLFLICLQVRHLSFHMNYPRRGRTPAVKRWGDLLCLGSDRRDWSANAREQELCGCHCFCRLTSKITLRVCQASINNKTQFIT